MPSLSKGWAESRSFNFPFSKCSLLLEHQLAISCRIPFQMKLIMWCWQSSLKVYSSVGFTARKICKALGHNDLHWGRYHYLSFFPYLAPQAPHRGFFLCSVWNIHENTFKMFGKQGGKYINLQSNLCAFQVTDLLRHFVHLFQSLVIDCSIVSPHSILVKLLLLVGWLIGLLHNSLLICCLLFGNTWAILGLKSRR